MMAVNIIVADAYPLLRAGIRVTITKDPQFHVTGEVSDGMELKLLCQQQPSDIVLLDATMPGPSVKENVQFLIQHFPQLKILVMFEREDQANLFPLLELGVDGYLYKDETPEVLLRALQAVAQGDSWVSRRVLALLIKKKDVSGFKRDPEKQMPSPLSSRELEILQLLANGLSNDQIALQLSIAERTVRHHVENILARLDAPNRTRAAMIAIKQGWIEP